MELVEVVLQGVKGSPQLSRWAFGNGVCVVPAGDREQLVARAAYELLAGITDGQIANAVLPGEAGAQGRAGVVVVGRDQRRYRVLWDLASGRRALQLQNGDKWDVITSTQAEILQALTATVGFPQQDALQELFFAFTDDLPSRRKDLVVAADKSGKNPKAPSSTPGFSSSGKPLPPGFGDAPPSRSEGKPLPPGFGDAEKRPRSRWSGQPESMLRARLAEINEATAAADAVTNIEFEVDGLQKRMFEMESRLKPLVELNRQVTGLDEQLQRYAYLDPLPADFLEQSHSASMAETDREADLRRLASERERVIEAAGHLSDEVSGIQRRGGPRPMQAAMQDPLVKFGIAGGVAAIVLAVVGGFMNDGLRWLALLDIPAFGAAVFGGIRLLNGLEEGASIRLKLARLDAEKKVIEGRFAIDKEQIVRLLQRAQLKREQLPEVEEHWVKREELRQRRGGVVEQRDQAQQSGDLLTVQAEQSQVQARIRELEDKLQTSARDYGPASSELLREKDEIEDVLRGGGDEEQPKPSLDDLLGPSSSFLSSSSSAASGSASSEAPLAYDVGQRIVRLASDVLLANLDDTMARLGPRASQMAQALTDRRFTEVRFGGKAEVLVFEPASSLEKPFGGLSPEDRDLIALALRLATVEAFAKKERMPVVFDRVFDLFPVEKSALFVRVLQFLGQSTQVVCLTARREMATAGPVVTAG